MKTDTKDRDRFDPWQNKDDNQNIQYEKRLLIAPTGWICLELLNLWLNLVQTGMKYPDLTTIWKGAMITTRKVSNIAWKSKTFIIFLDLYYSYKNFNGDVPIINVDDMLCETIKYVNK